MAILNTTYRDIFVQILRVNLKGWKQRVDSIIELQLIDDKQDELFELQALISKTKSFLRDEFGELE